VPGSFDKAQPEDVGTGGAFKVPALWAASQTAPYFHDGRTKTLEEAARTMWETTSKKNGKPSSPTAAQMADLMAYLNSL
jgi:cytochrome c peroxidase